MIVKRKLYSKKQKKLTEDEKKAIRLYKKLKEEDKVEYRERFDPEIQAVIHENNERAKRGEKPYYDTGANLGAILGAGTGYIAKRAVKKLSSGEKKGTGLILAGTIVGSAKGFNHGLKKEQDRVKEIKKNYRENPEKYKDIVDTRPTDLADVADNKLSIKDYLEKHKR